LGGGTTGGAARGFEGSGKEKESLMVDEEQGTEERKEAESKLVRNMANTHVDMSGQTTK